MNNIHYYSLKDMFYSGCKATIVSAAHSLMPSSRALKERAEPHLKSCKYSKEVVKVKNDSLRRLTMALDDGAGDRNQI